MSVFPRQPLQYVAKIDPSKREIRGLDPDLPVTFIPMDAVGFGGVLPTNGVRELGDVIEGYTYLREGDVAFAKISPSFQNRKGGRAEGLTNRLALATTELTVLRPRFDLDQRFLSYVVQSDDFRQAGTATLYGVAGQQRVSSGFVRDFPVPMPPLQVQRRIADYLDAETARIDDLVKMNIRLSAASLERLHRLIVESTLGHPRRPDAQDLGVAFDGVFAPVHAVARVGTGHTPSRNVSEYWQDCDIPWLNIPDLAEAREFWSDQVTETAEHLNAAGLKNSAAVLCPIGTVFVTRTASIGHAAINSVPMATNQRLVTYYPDSSRLDGHFLLWSIRALKLIGHFDRLTFGATHDTIYYDDMVALRVPLRDLAKQHAAVAAIRELRNEVVALRERFGRSSRLLQERRQALITAAVTGELEV